MAYHICRIFCFLQSGLDERHLAAVLLENDKILPFRPLMSFRSHPVATTLGRLTRKRRNQGECTQKLFPVQGKKFSSALWKNRELTQKSR